MATKISLVGQTFGRLKVIADAERKPLPSGQFASRSKCQCSCGVIAIVGNHELRRGDTKSCGCLLREWIRTLHPPKKAVSIKRARTYRAWQSMLNRCRNPRANGYKNYGGRGIKVCPEWKSSFPSFIEDVGECPEATLTLERLDNNKDYEPGNVVWATRHQQARNTRRNQLFTLNGVTKCAMDWAKHFGISASVIYTRIHRGWSLESAVMTPLRNWSEMNSDQRAIQLLPAQSKRWT